MLVDFNMTRCITSRQHCGASILCFSCSFYHHMACDVADSICVDVSLRIYFYSADMDKKSKIMAGPNGNNEKKRREKISANIHVLADMLPEAMRDPKHKEVSADVDGVQINVTIVRQSYLELRIKQ